MNCRLLISVLALSSISFLLTGQPEKRITITGRVIDAEQRPVEGASVFVDMVKTNSITDQSGTFMVEVSPGAREILVFTFRAGATKEFINGRSVIEFKLPGIPLTSERVNIGYGTAYRRTATIQTGKIDGQSSEFAAYSNIYDMIRGRLPGVEVTGNSIRIAGSSSLHVSTEPLFVVNNIIVRSIDHIPPQNVKSIEVLKGPAASVYGARGAHGVILITLLSGKD